MQVISASARTDIPAFYGDWFMERVREGYVRTKNPYGPQIGTVSLKPADVHAIVFWSKNYAPFLHHLSELDERGLDAYFHFTVDGYTLDERTRPIERKVPKPKVQLRSFRALAERYSPKHVLWRYHPLIFTPIIDGDWHRRRFAELAQMLEGLTERCHFGFLDFLQKTVRNMHQLPEELRPFEPPTEDQVQLMLELAAIASQHGITLYSCAEDFAAVGPIRRGACVDRELLDELWPHKAQPLALYPSRGECGCVENRDIGAYDTCVHDCRYCYAVTSRPVAIGRYKAHDQALDIHFQLPKKD